MRLLVTALMTLALTGCGLSPQMIDISPSPATSSENIGNNQAVAITVRDERPNSAFGTRGGLYRDTALIRAANDLPEAVRTALQKGLQSRGYNAYNPGDGARALDVMVTTLEYIPEAGTIVNQVRVNARLKAVASDSSDASYTGVYRTSNDYQQPLTPSAKQNQEMINEVLERALDKLLADQALHDFLSKP